MAMTPICSTLILARQRVTEERHGVEQQEYSLKVLKIFIVRRMMLWVIFSAT